MSTRGTQSTTKSDDMLVSIQQQTHGREADQTSAPGTVHEQTGNPLYQSLATEKFDWEVFCARRNGPFGHEFWCNHTFQKVECDSKSKNPQKIKVSCRAYCVKAVNGVEVVIPILTNDLERTTYTVAYHCGSPAIIFLQLQTIKPIEVILTEHVLKTDGSSLDVPALYIRDSTHPEKVFVLTES